MEVIMASKGKKEEQLKKFLMLALKLGESIYQK